MQNHCQVTQWKKDQSMNFRAKIQMRVMKKCIINHATNDRMSDKKVMKVCWLMGDKKVEGLIQLIIDSLRFGLFLD